MPTQVLPVISKPLAERIIQATCIHFGITEEKLKTNSDHDTAYYRKISYTLLRDECCMSYGRIGARFGQASHSFVWLSVDQIKSRKKYSRQVTDDLEKVMKISIILEQSPASAFDYGMD